MKSRLAVRDLFFHEVFHLNEGDRDDWSRRMLGPIVDKIVAKCGVSRVCLKPYAPHSLTVRGGTYYAFQPNNGDMAREYAAELAKRYLIEQGHALRNEVYPGGWFKCALSENARAMALLADEFFAGFDATPSCKTK